MEVESSDSVLDRDTGSVPHRNIPNASTERDTGIKQGLGAKASGLSSSDDHGHSPREAATPLPTRNPPC